MRQTKQQKETKLKKFTEENKKLGKYEKSIIKGMNKKLLMKQ